MNITIGGKNIPGEYLTNPEDIQRGMMGRTSLDGCMVFKMSRGHHSFWMKNCLIPLDIVFVLNSRVTQIHRDCPPPDVHRMNPPRYTGIGDHVIEFEGGTCPDVKVGDKVGIYP